VNLPSARDVPVGQARRHRFAVDTQRLLQTFYRAGGIDIRFDAYGRVRSVNLVPQGLHR
jgi:hypothetical protein